MSKAIIIFDGVCNFCNASINFIIKHDHSTRFMFATTQGEHGTKILKDLNIDPKDPTTFVFIEGQIVYVKSDAALQIAKHLKRPWSALAWLKFVPKLIRDSVYSLIAKHRYKILGKRQTCMVPSPELKKRFLD
jgi:predicted DCC family thiol-disulfide oxidoreductase YuxK